MSNSYPAIYTKLKAYLADRAGLGSGNEVYADWKLADHPLRYNVAGKRALASALNALFPRPPRTQTLTATQTEKAKKVRDLAKLVKKAHE